MARKSELLKISGYIILAVSCLLFILIPVVPWFHFSAAKVAGITAGLIIAGEVLFYLSLFILGRAFFDKIKAKLKFWKSGSKDSNSTTEEK